MLRLGRRSRRGLRRLVTAFQRRLADESSHLSKLRPGKPLTEIASIRVGKLPMDIPGVRARMASVKAVPLPFREPPRLDPGFRPKEISPRHALLVNPFYRKDRTPASASTSSRPPWPAQLRCRFHPGNWTVAYWTRTCSRVHRPPIHFHASWGSRSICTFAKRAYELARLVPGTWRDRRLRRIACALLSRGGPPHGDVLAIGEGVQLWGRILRDIEAGCVLPEYTGSYREPYGMISPPRRDLLPRESFCTTTSLIATRGCHNRCGFCYLATDGLRMPYQCGHAGATRLRVRWKTASPTAVSTDNNLGSKPEHLRELAAACSALERIWSAAITLDVTDDPSLIREMALAGCTGVFIGFEIARKREHHRSTQEKPAHRRLRQTSGGAPRQRHPGKREFRPGV